MNSREVSKGGIVVSAITLLALSGGKQTLVSGSFFIGAGVSLLIRSLLSRLTFPVGFAAFIGGGLGAVALLGLWGLSVSLLRGNFGMAFTESIVVIVIGIPLSFWLLKRFAFREYFLGSQETVIDTRVSTEEKAEEELSRAIKLEAKGNFDEASALYKSIIMSYPDTTAATEAKDCLAALEKRMEGEN